MNQTQKKTKLLPLTGKPSMISYFAITSLSVLLLPPAQIHNQTFSAFSAKTNKKSLQANTSEKLNVSSHIYTIQIYKIYNYYTRFGIFSRSICINWYQKGKIILDLNEAKNDGISGCSGISWTICK